MMPRLALTPSSGRADETHGTTSRRSSVLRSLALLQSPAWSILPEAAKRLLDRLEIEQIQRGSTTIALAVGYREFARFGVGNKRVIARAIRQAEALGMITVIRTLTCNGNRYRLNYGPCGRHGWRKIVSTKDAEQQLRAACRKRRRREPPREGPYLAYSAT
jgi:hypothetical protein